MLSSLDDPASLGPNMAVALLTTLYGTILANLVFLPMASKLEIKTEEDIFMKQIIIEGIIGVQSGQSPHILEEKLSAFLLDEGKRITKMDGYLFGYGHFDTCFFHFIIFYVSNRPIEIRIDYGIISKQKCTGLYINRYII